MGASVTANDLGVRFLFDRNRRVLTPAMARLHRHVIDHWGLRDLSLSIGPGEGVALVGPSGSGKTTLLRVLAGVYTPDRGRVVVRGRIGSLLSVNAGLLSGLTGRENAQLLGVLGGMSLAKTRRALPEIKSESGLGDAFERPVSAFSQGMRARLGFSVADQLQPDILLLDEVHEALDHEFRYEVERVAERILSSGGIVVAAGHDHAMLERICARALLMRTGRIERDGGFTSVESEYVHHP
jgi:ABC-type polysaccharide/polyol phosphate transport system ATPase subunit